jgi:hypothetical protein
MSCCCILLNVEIVPFKGDDFSFQWSIEPEIDPKTDLCYYSFSFEGDIFYIVWVPTEIDGGRWQIQDSLGTVLYYLPSAYVCPVSNLNDWIMTPEGGEFFTLVSLFISETACSDPEIDIPTEGNHILNCDEYFSCKFVNLLKKQKAVLSDDISKIKNYQVFGLKGCHEKWENIFMRHLIMDALKCSPYGVYSEDTENCLINRLTENCNC